MAEAQEQHPLEVDPQEVKTRLDAGDGFLLLDCREPVEWEAVRIDGATLLPMSEMLARVGELDAYKEQEIIVYCHHGGRSLRVAYWLNNQGFAAVRSMSGGIDLWAEQIDTTLARY